LLVFAGLAHLVRIAARRELTKWVAAAIAAAMGAWAIAALAGYLAPAYAKPAEPGETNLPAHAVDVTFGDVARLRGYEVSADTIMPGEPLFVTLHWEALRPTEKPLSVFVHLLGLYDIPVATRATYAGLGIYPTTLWVPGREFVETYRVDVPKTANRPNWLLLDVGLFDATTGARLPVAVDAGDVGPNPAGDALLLGQVNVPPPPAGDEPVYVPLDVNYGDRIKLMGYTLYPPVTNPGRDVYVTLYWQAMRPLEDESVEDLRVFLQALGEDGEVYTSLDGYPQGGLSLPSTWTPGEIVRDERRLRFSQSTPDSFYTLLLGWMDQVSGERLPILKPDGTWEGDALELPALRKVATQEAGDRWLSLEACRPRER
jgi:hypothetical protein